MISNIANFRKKLLFRSSHRGTKEMDLLLGGFFKENYNNLTTDELLEFERILQLADKKLSDWLILDVLCEEIDKFQISKKIKNFKIKL